MKAMFQGGQASAPAAKRYVRSKEMELTKFEKRVMNPRYLNMCKWSCLYLGISLIVMGICVEIYGRMTQVPRITAIWDNKTTSLTKIVPNTEMEHKLYSIAIFATDAASKGWKGYVEATTLLVELSFLFTGSFLIVTFLREKRYKGLIGKIIAPNQAL